MADIWKFLRCLPLLAVMGGIFFLSHQPGATLPLPDLWGLDKLLHALAYAVLAASVIGAFPSLIGWPEGSFAGLGIVLFCILYGLSDEFHQSFIPARIASGGDLLADTVGAFLLVFVVRHRLVIVGKTLRW